MAATTGKGSIRGETMKDRRSQSEMEKQRDEGGHRFPWFYWILELLRSAVPASEPPEIRNHSNHSFLKNIFLIIESVP